MGWAYPLPLLKRDPGAVEIAWVRFLGDEMGVDYGVVVFMVVWALGLGVIMWRGRP